MIGVLPVSTEGILDGYNGHANLLYISPFSAVAPFNPRITLSVANSLSSVVIGTTESIGVR